MIYDVAKSWRDGYKRPCIVLPCGGGKSIITADMAKRTTDNGNSVLFIVHRHELCEQIERTFTEYGVNMNLCTVGMVQTVTRRLDKLDRPKLIITDENHHCLAQSYRRIYDRFPDVRCVGVTATPVRLNGGGLGDVNDKLIIGPSAKELVESGYLSPYRYFAPSVADLTGIHTKRGEYVTSEVEAALDKPRIYGDVVKYYRKLSDRKQAICYCASLKTSRETADAFTAHGIPAAHIDGETPQREREDIVNRFRRGELMVLCNVDLISEGFDVPDCYTSILLRPTKSLTLYIQQSMRCMRYVSGKVATIIDHVGNVGRFGLPDADREWSLTPDKRKSRGDGVNVRQCPECYYTHLPAAVCPNCGYRYKAKERPELKAICEARLVEIVASYQAPEQCRSAKELILYAKKKGYKPGWAYYQAKQRGILR